MDILKDNLDTIWMICDYLIKIVGIQLNWYFNEIFSMK